MAVVIHYDCFYYLLYQGAFGSLVSSLYNLSNGDSTIILCYEKRHGIEAKFFQKLSKLFEWTDHKPSHPDFKDSASMFVLKLKRRVVDDCGGTLDRVVDC